jgi:hypothetical protein
MIYNYKINNTDKLNHYLQKLEHFNFGSISAVEVFETNLIKELLDETATKPEENQQILGKLKVVLSKAPRGLFVETLHDKIIKILE